MAASKHEYKQLKQEEADAINNSSESNANIDASETNKTKLNIALVGETESGKSSFINAILGLKEGDEGAAGTGFEKTTIHKSYLHPLNPDVIIWDLPGLDTVEQPDFKTYSNTLYLDGFDAFLIYIKGKYTRTDLEIAKGIDKKQKPFFLVRTKIDNDLSRCAENSNEDEIVKKIRENLLEMMKRLKKNSDATGNEVGSDDEKKIFLIDNFDPEKWDFHSLKEATQKKMLARPSECVPTEEKEKRLFGMLRKKVEEDEDLFNECSGLEEVQKKREQRLVAWRQEKIKIGIVGCSGVGKSSFINALRGLPLKSEVPEKARTGPTEVTLEPTSYYYPNAPLVKLWDLPGIGSEYFPDLKTYCEAIPFTEFDIFVIVTSTRFSRIDKELASKFNFIKRSLFVRTKIDMDCQNEKKTKPTTFDEKKMLHEIKNHCAENLKDVLIPGKKYIFLTSNHYPLKWDFPKLVDAFINELSVGKQQTAFVLSMSIVSEKLLEEKVKILEDRTWLVALNSVVEKSGSAEKSYTYNSRVIREVVEFYLHQFGFPAKDSEEFKKLPILLQKNMQKFYLTGEEEVESYLKQLNSDNMEADDDFISWLDKKKKKKVSKKLQWLYGEENIWKPFVFVYFSLHRLLDEMKNISLVILFQKLGKHCE